MNRLHLLSRSFSVTTGKWWWWWCMFHMQLGQTNQQTLFASIHHIPLLQRLTQTLRRCTTLPYFLFQSPAVLCSPLSILLPLSPSARHHCQWCWFGTGLIRSKAMWVVINGLLSLSDRWIDLPDWHCIIWGWEDTSLVSLLTCRLNAERIERWANWTLSELNSDCSAFNLRSNLW